MFQHKKQFQKLAAARLAADIYNTPTVLLARTDEAANLLTSDIDERDREFTTGERTSEWLYRVKMGLIKQYPRGLAYAPYADLVWCETGVPDLDFAKKFAEALKKSIQNNCLHITARRLLTGKRILMMRKLLNSRKSLGQWGISFNLSPLQDSMH